MFAILLDFWIASFALTVEPVVLGVTQRLYIVGMGTFLEGCWTVENRRRHVGIDTVGGGACSGQWAIWGVSQRANVGARRWGKGSVDPTSNQSQLLASTCPRAKRGRREV